MGCCHVSSSTRCLGVTEAPVRLNNEYGGCVLEKDQPSAERDVEYYCFVNDYHGD